MNQAVGEVVPRETFDQADHAEQVAAVIGDHVTSPQAAGH